MTVLRWILAELRYRKVSSCAALFGVTVAATLAVALAHLEHAFERETRRIVRNIGFNVRILPRSADLDQFYLDDFTDSTLPEDAVHRLAGAGDIAYNHLVATLKRKIELMESPVYLVGVSQTYFPQGKKKPPMMFAVQPGTVHVGTRVAERLDLAKDDALQLPSSPNTEATFRIARVMPRTSTRDDVTIYGHLGDVQRVLGLDGRINEIQAIDCLCLTADENPAAVLERQLEEILPEAQVFHLATIADARARQRRTVEQLGAILVPLVALAAAFGVAVLAFLNVRDRREEIGVLRALGHGAGRIAALFLGKAALLGVVGGALGFAAGTAIALTAGPRLFELTAKAIRIDYGWLGLAMLVAPGFALLATALPTLWATRCAPTQTLAPR